MKLRFSGFIIICFVVAALVVGCGSKATVKSDKAVPQSTPSKAQLGPSDAKKSAGANVPSGQNTAPVVQAVLKDVYFDFDRYTIRTEDANTLKQDYAWFKANTGKRVKIEGNCDERGSVEYNLALGQKRADATKNYLLKLGVPANVIETVSYGKEKPVDPGHTEQAWAKNRRAHFETAK